MELKKPLGCSDCNYVQIYATECKYNVIKNNKNEYICCCPSLLDECRHIKEFKKKELEGEIK